MSSMKRERDTEYSYDQQETSVESIDITQTQNMAQTSNDHVANLLAQARISGLLPDNGVAQSENLPPTGTASPISGIFGLGRIPKFSQQQQHPANAQGNDAKRRKLNNNSP